MTSRPPGESEASIARTRRKALDWHILDCCSSAKWARRLITCATLPWVKLLSKIVPPFVVEHVTGVNAVGWLPARQVAAAAAAAASQPIPGWVWASPPNPGARICACFDVAPSSVTSARCRRGPLLVVWSAVSKLAAATSCHCEVATMGLVGRLDGHHPPPTTLRIPVPARSRVSGAAAMLGRPSSAPDETVCLASRLANWACDTVSAKNSNSYQLATRRMVTETEALAGGK